MNKLGLFLTGAVVGAAGLALTACLAEGFPSATSSYDDTDNDDNNEDTETNGKADAAETSPLLKTTDESASAYSKTDISDKKEIPHEEHPAGTKNSTAETIGKLTEVLSELIKTIPKSTAAAN